MMRLWSMDYGARCMVGGRPVVYNCKDLIKENINLVVNVIFVE